MARFGFDIERVSRVEPVAVEIQQPPRPVEPGTSKPQRTAGHAVAYTLYRMGFWGRDPLHIPMALRTSRNQRPRAASGNSGQKPLHGGSVITRAIPPSYSDSVSG